MSEKSEFYQQERPFHKKLLWWAGFGAVGVVLVGAAAHFLPAGIEAVKEQVAKAGEIARG